LRSLSRHQRPRVRMRWFNNLSATVKLMSGFALVGIFMGLIGWLAIHSMGTLNANMEYIYEVQYLPSLDLSDLRGETEAARVLTVRAVAVSDPAEIKDNVEKTLKLEKRIEVLWDKIEAENRSEQGRVAFKKYRKVAERYNKERDERVFRPLLAGD